MKWSDNTTKWSAFRVTMFTAFAILLNGTAVAETFQKLFDFDAPPRHPSSALCKASDGYFYGSTRGTSHAIFNEGSAIYRMSPQGEVTVLNFLPSGKGMELGSFTEGNDGNLYAVKSLGRGAAGIVRVSTTGVLETIAEFNRTNGATPALSRLVKGSDGAFYGVTQEGGTANLGTLFRVTTAGELTVVHSFVIGSLEGYQPMTLIAGLDGDYYGTTLRGGANGRGTLFKVTREGVVTPVTSFQEASGSPSGILVQGDDGSFFGVPFPSVNQRLIYKVARTGGTPTLINLTNAVTSLAKGADGNFYAVLSGTPTKVVKVTQGGQISSVAETSQPLTAVSEMIESETGTFLGATSNGGTNSIGALFKIDTTLGNILIIYSFTWLEGGSAPSGRLLRTQDGSLYGTLARGGPEGRGAVFRVVDGVVTNVYGFAGTTVNQPVAGLTLGADGNLYGVSLNGGTHALGSVFRVTPAGVVSDVASFTNASTGRFPGAELVLSSSGDLYGTTRSGGQDDAGTIFRVTPDGSLTLVASIISGLHAKEPAGPLVEHTDGSFIGANWRHGFALGSQTAGAVYQVRTNGEITTLLAFSQNGAHPTSSLVKSTEDGYYYGTTALGGTNGGWGTIFRFNPEQERTILHTFGRDESVPYGLMQANNGFFYGMTIPTNAPGTLFRMNPQAEVVTLHTFNAEDGFNAAGPLCEGADGWLYGVRPSGGLRGGGTLFRINPRAPFIQRDSVSLTNAHAKFLVHGGPGVDTLIQRSSDLVSWTSISTNIPPTGTLSFVDDEGGGATQVFYRVRPAQD